MESLIQKFEDITMEEEDTDMYSSPFGNYLRLVETIQTLEAGVRLTEDWYEEHKQHILTYRKEFPNFSNINEDFEDSEFRTKAKEVELVLNSLVREVKMKTLFNTKTYLILNKLLKEMCELIWTQEELSEILGKMSM